MARILIIDDDAAICKALGRLLQYHGHEVILAHDGTSGLKAATTKPDLVVCDIAMPGMGGHDVLTALRQDKRLEETPFIFLSGQIDRDSVRRSMNLGGDDFIPKPSDPQVILDAINARLQRRQRQQQRREEVVKKAMQIFAGIVDDLGDSAAAIHWLAEAASSGQPVTARPEVSAAPLAPATVTEANAAALAEADDAGAFLAAKDNRKFFVKLSEVKALLAEGEYSRAFWGNDQHMMFRKPLKQWEKELPAGQFLRVHRKAIINLAFLECVSRSPDGSPQVHLKGFKEVIEVSQRKTPALNRTLKSLSRA